ncbi:MAG: PorT family protein [Candidatus Saccharicenans sp.]|nr:PorT family protein [Candidatus Saccharicenans sp.]MDH7492962.1 porin family protein [Candidatus Saccharicenans sp.]
MRRSLVLTIFLSLLIIGLPAEAGRISVGFKGGMNLVNISVSPRPIDVAGFKNLNGLTGGLFLSLKLGPIAIQPEFMFARRGTQYEAYIDDGFYNVEWHHDYLEVMLLLKWSVLQAGPVGPFIYAGPSYGYLMKAASVIYDTEGAEVARADSRDYFRKGELALVFGSGLEFKVRAIKLSLEGRYHLGLSSVALAGFEVDYIKNKSISILAGISF